jgi:hypothetical protein
MLKIYILLISVYKFECVSELFVYSTVISIKLTNTFKPTHKNEQNTNETP